MSMVDVLGLLADADWDGVDPGCRVPGNVKCPFHDDATASLYLWNDHWRCFVCDIGGNALDFIGRALGGSAGQAKKWLEGTLGEEVEWSTFERVPAEPVDLSEHFHREVYLARPGAWAEAWRWALQTWPHLTAKQLSWWGVAPASYYLLIPHEDADGRIVGVKTRTFVGGNKGAKRSFTGSTYPRLYRVEDRPEAEAAWLVEGESDTWTQTLAWPKEQVFGLPCGCNTWRPEYRDELLKYSTIWVALDNDEPGRTAARRIYADLSDNRDPSWQHVFRVEVPPPHKDWTELAIAKMQAT